MMNIDDFIRFQHDLLNQQKDQKSIQKETIKLVALLSQNVNIMSEKLDDLIEKATSKLKDKKIKIELKDSPPKPASLSISKLIQDTSPRILMLNDIKTEICEETTISDQEEEEEEEIEEEGSDDEDENDDEKETIQVRKKPKLNNKHDESNNQQRLFNKYVRENVENQLGEDFLLTHEIQEIDTNIMDEIKRNAFLEYPPINIRPRRAWHLAKASLRCRRRSLRQKKEKLSLNSNRSSSSANLDDF